MTSIRSDATDRKVMTTSKIGNRRGFTLIELMAAVAILSLGTSLIQEGLLRSLTLLGRYSHSLKAQAWMDERLWQAEEDTFYAQEGGGGERAGEFTDEGKAYTWSLQSMPLNGTTALYSFKLIVVWAESGRTLSLTRERYGIKPKLV